MVEANEHNPSDITAKAKNEIEALKEAYEELKEMGGEENIISAVIHVDETTPHLHCDFGAVDRWESIIGERRG